MALNEVLADNKNAVSNGGEHPDYVELFNRHTAALDIGGQSLTDDPAQPRKFVFPPNTFVPASGYLLVWCDTNSLAPGVHTGFRISAGGERIRLYAANGLTVLDEIVFGVQGVDISIGRSPDGTGGWTLTAPTPLAPNEPQETGPPDLLVINEWMARPSAGEDWFEVYNGSPLPVALSGLVLTDMATGTPTNRPIPALSFIGARGFLQFFASDLEETDANHVDFKLGGSGDTLTIYAPNRSTILHRMVYGSQSEDISQGRVPDGSDNLAFFPIGRATPGAANYAMVMQVVISEVLSHTDPPLEDAIELHNPAATAVDISYWWLSDAATLPKKYRIPAGTVLSPGGYKAFYQYQFGAGVNGFTLDSAEGDQVYLSAANAAGTLTGEQTYVDFGGLKNGVSVGRHLTSVGADFVPMSGRTFGVDNPGTLTQFRTGTGLPNALPRVGPIVITEIMPYPPDVGGVSNTDDEYIELHNPTEGRVYLYDLPYPTNTWRLRDGVSFDFPRTKSILPGGFLLLVNFDPAAQPALLATFRSKYAVPEGVEILGPYGGKLSDAGEGLVLRWPDEPEGPGEHNPGYVPYEQVERIKYYTSFPWPEGADGTGLSLQRRNPLGYGNEPTNWFAAAPSPGRAAAADTDSDGMPDDWERAHGLNPDSSADAHLDPDGDQADNLSEYLAGTDPQDPSSVLRILSAEPGVGSVTLTFLAAPNRSYTVQTCSDLSLLNWQGVTNITAGAAGGPTDVTLPVAGSGNRFFRVLTPASP